MYLIQQIWGIVVAAGAMGLLAGLWSRKRFDAKLMAVELDQQAQRAHALTEDLETDHARVLAAMREEHESVLRALSVTHADAVQALRKDHAKASQALKSRCDSLVAERRVLEQALDHEKKMHASVRSDLRLLADAARTSKAQSEADVSYWMSRAQGFDEAKQALELRLRQSQEDGTAAIHSLAQHVEEARIKEAELSLHINRLKTSGELSRRRHVGALSEPTEADKELAVARGELEVLVEDLQEQLEAARQTLERVVQASEAKEERLSVEIIEQRAELERLRQERAQSMRRAVGQHRASRLALLAVEDVERLVRDAGTGRPPMAAPLEGVDPDDLKLVAGIDAQAENWLHGMGIFFYWQIASWTPEEVAWVAQHLPRAGREVWRGNWMAQCARLAARIGLPA